MPPSSTPLDSAPSRFPIMTFLFALVAGAVLSPTLAADGQDPRDLETLLKGLNWASRLYLDSALKFSCQETITERSPGWKSSHRFEYIYVYDDSKGYVDYRTRMGSEDSRPVNPQEAGVQRFLERAYFWVLIFSHPRQRFHRYGIEGGGRVLRRDAVRIRFEALPPFQDGINDWTGTAWIDPESLQILRVEATRAAELALQSRIENEIPGATGSDLPTPGSLYAITRVATEFSVEKNEMRFPGKVEIVQSTYRRPLTGPPAVSQKVYESLTTQSYAHYQFFGVRTREEVQRILAGADAGRTPD